MGNLVVNAGSTKHNFGALAVEGFGCAGGRLFSAKSYISDRIEPYVEELILPGVKLSPGKIEWHLSESEDLSSSAQAGRLKRFASYIQQRGEPLKIDGIFIDFRKHYPGNWAHALNSHLPLALYLRNCVIAWNKRQPITIVLDVGIPLFIIKLFDLFGFRVAVSSGAVSGVSLKYSVDGWDCLRSIARRFVVDYFPVESAGLQIDRSKTELPEKVFLSRRGTRYLVNKSEVNELLLRRGYQIVYPEDLSVTDQIKLFMRASHMVAVHGAGLGPLLYRPSSMPSLQLVELLSPGHMTNYYRVMASQVGADWVGVRGRIEKAHIEGVYAFDQRYRKQSLKPFFIDLQSLERALAYLDIRDEKMKPVLASTNSDSIRVEDEA